MGRKSVATHEFRRGVIENDTPCLYSAFRYVNGTFGTIDNKCLHDLVADRTVKTSTLQGGDPNVQALSMLARRSIRLVSMKKSYQGNISVTMLEYKDKLELFKQCVHILYNEENQQYEPLYVVNKQNPTKILTIFERDDTLILELLGKFIREELHDVDYVQSGGGNSAEGTELSTRTNLVNATEQLYDMIVPTAARDLSIKRKLPSHDGLLLAPHLVKELLVRDNTSLEKPAKLVKADTDKTSTISEADFVPMTMEQFLQTNLFASEADTVMEQGSTSIAPERFGQTTSMRLEVEPAEEFRGRTKGDFEPMKELTRKGAPSTIRKPRHFCDRNGRNCLNLLIAETNLSAGLLRTCFEICIVTREINGYTYINPYFKFKVQPNNPAAPCLNPMYIFLDNTTELKPYSEILRQLKLRLVVAVDKIGELMQRPQPLQIFSTPNNNQNGGAITTTYNQSDPFIRAYHLRDMRFAITLWTKAPGEKVFERHSQIQYISEISTENRKYKKPEE